MPAKILIVDDNELNLDMLTRRLQRADFEVVAARSAAEAIGMIEGTAPDLVLFDIMDAEEAGLEALQEIRKVHDMTELPIIMVTSRLESKVIVEALDLGANDYVTKPIDFPVLMARMRAHLRLKTLEAAIRRMAFTDALTGLPNRRLFQDRLERGLKLARRQGDHLAVFYLDMDYFKRINDTLGHDIGDQVIRRFAERLVTAVRDSDTVARLGGDEFTVLLQGLKSPDDALRVAHKILAAMNEPMAVAGTEVVVTTSIGISVFPEDGDDPVALMKQADTAMYVAKQERNAVRFYAEAATNAAT
jgi:diguanylate cyclase (GGDEF)-like protein